MDELNNIPILNSSNLNDATNQLNSEILSTIDKTAQQQVNKITSRIRKPWYDVDLKQQRHIVKTWKGNGSNEGNNHTGRHTKGKETDSSQ